MRQRNQGVSMPAGGKSAAKKAQRASTAANKAPAFVFDAKAEVAAAWKAFPHLEDTVFFLDVMAHKLIYPGDEQKRLRVSARLSQSDWLQDAVAYYRDTHKTSAYVRALSGAGGYVMLYTGEMHHKGWDKVMPEDQLRAFIFDHELAHAAIPEAGGDEKLSDNINMAESIADAFAVMRHFQRFGTDSDAVVKLAELRAARFVFGQDESDNYKTTHFTSPVVDEIIRNKNKADWGALDMRDLARLATRFGQRHALHPTVLSQLSGGFSPFSNTFNAIAAGKTAPLGKLAADLAAAQGPLSVKWGAAALRYFLRGTSADSKLAGDWAKVEKKLKALKGNDDIFLGIPAARKKPQIIANQR